MPIKELAAPDYSGPLVAWRVWHVAETEAGLRLQSPLRGTIWRPGEPLRADCLRPWFARRLHPHAAPAEGCACGVYAGSLGLAASYLGRPRSRRSVLGRLSLWGDVIQCERGYRGSIAYPAHLYVPTRTRDGRHRRDSVGAARQLEAYGVPVTLLDADDVGCAQALAAGE